MVHRSALTPYKEHHMAQCHDTDVSTKQVHLPPTVIMNNCIVRSFRDVIVITKFATRRASKA